MPHLYIANPSDLDPILCPFCGRIAGYKDRTEYLVRTCECGKLVVYPEVPDPIYLALTLLLKHGFGSVSYEYRCGKLALVSPALVAKIPSA